MALVARDAFTEQRNAREAGREVGQRLLAGGGGPPAVVLVYLTINHDPVAFLAALQATVGPGVAIVGSSAQGVIGKGAVREIGYAASALGLGGPGLAVATARVDDLRVATAAKGRALGQALRAELVVAPKLVVLHYDPLAGADAGVLLDAIQAEVGCPIVGGASSHPAGVPINQTQQYRAGEVFSLGASAVALGGALAVDIAACAGCAPVGLDMEVTRADGNSLLELDGRPALDVWLEVTGTSGDRPAANDTAALAIGVPAATGGEAIRAAFLLDRDRRGIVLQAAVATGTRVRLHHRTVQAVLDGATTLGGELRARLAGKQPRAVLAFECGARTAPFLGAVLTLRENLELQAAVAPTAAWCGFMPWGELFPVGGRAAFHNYTYPVVVLSDGPP